MTKYETANTISDAYDFIATNSDGADEDTNEQELLDRLIEIERILRKRKSRWSKYQTEQTK